MTSASPIARHQPLPAARTHVAGALGSAMLGAVTGLVAGAAILVGAPVVGGARSLGDAHFDGPPSPSLAGLPAPVAAVVAPARGVARAAGQDRQAANP